MGLSPVAPGRPLRALHEVRVPRGQEDRVARVATARVVYVDHALLVHDLSALGDPAVAGPGEAAERFREAWLLDNAAVVSVAQAGQTLVNTPVHTEGEPRLAWRPPRYGRAVVVQAGLSGARAGQPDALLLDVKGAGLGPHRRFSTEHHASGLCQLREVLREALFASAMAKIFARATGDVWTLPIYGVIDLGFDVRTHRGDQLPAGVLVRRAHLRDEDDIVLPRRGSDAERLTLEFELLLRHYGITSSNAGTRYHIERGPHGLRAAFGFEALRNVDAPTEALIAQALSDVTLPVTCNTINIQLARGGEMPGMRGQLVDFGHYEVRSSFRRPLVTTVCDAPMRWGTALLPDDADFVQPDADLRAMLDGWARTDDADAGGAPRSVADPTMRWAHEAAQAFRRGEMLGKEIAASIAALGVDSR